LEVTPLHRESDTPALGVTFRRLGGVPTYVLTDNEKTVTSEHIAGIPVRNPQLVAFAEHYAVTVHTETWRSWRTRRTSMCICLTRSSTELKVTIRRTRCANETSTATP
jgi:transposase